MDLWQWVENLQKDLAEAGQVHNARLIDDISSYCADNELEKAEAALPEAKALCQTLDNPWLSVYVGHWEMRHRIGNKKEGEVALADAVALFEYAHREETQDCPQSVCVTQDLASCYAQVDGMGWAEERIAVSEETLARIDPSWNCYQCLSCEKADALLDQHKPDEALAYMDEVTEQLLAAGETVGPGIVEFKNHALLAMGKYSEVLTRISEAEIKAAKSEFREWNNIARPRAIQKAYALARLNQDDEAIDALPLLRDTHIGGVFSWLEAIYPVILRRSEMNTWQLGRQLQVALDNLSVNGSHRLAIQMAEMTIRLAVARGARWNAQKQLQLAKSHLPKLRVDGGAGALLDELQALINDMPEAQLPVPAEQLLEWLNSSAQDGGADSSDNGSIDSVPDDNAVSKLPSAPSERNPEQEIQWLLAALQIRPDDADLHHQTAHALQACGDAKEGAKLLWSYIDRHLRSGKDNLADSDATSNDTPVRFSLLELLLETKDYEGIGKLAALYEQAGDPVFANWCLAQQAYQQVDWQGVERHIQELLTHDTEAYGAQSLLARSLMQQQRYAEAAEQYAALAKAVSDNNDYKWDFMTAASAAEQWRDVRDMAKNTLEMQIDVNDDAPNEDWGWIILRYIEDGDAKDYYARRTGPVSARIIENSAPMNKQHVGDHVVFDAQVLIPPPEDEEERENFIPTFGVVHTLTSGDYRSSIFIDGAHPEEAQLEAFEATCKAQDWRLWIHSHSSYEVIDSENDDQPLRGIMMTLAVPNGVSDIQVDTFLQEQTKDWAHQMCWLRLAEAAGVNTQPHHDVIERYGL